MSPNNTPYPETASAPAGSPPQGWAPGQVMISIKPQQRLKQSFRQAGVDEVLLSLHAIKKNDR